MREATSNRPAARRARRGRLLPGGAILVSAALILGACGGDDSSSDETTAPSAETTSPVASTDSTEATTDSTDATTETTTGDQPAEEGDVCTADKPHTDELTVSTAGDRKGFDPAQVTGAGQITGGVELTALYDTLMRWNPEQAEFEPQLAESLTTDDNVTWTLKLRPDVKFGNGDPLDGAAVQASIERLRGAKVSAAGTLDLIASIEVTDPQTVVFTLNGAWGDFPYFLASPGGMIVNAKIATELGPEAFNTNPAGAGAGPFEFTSFASGEDIVMTAKPDYHGGPLCFDTLRIVQINDDRAAMESLELGEIAVRSFGAADVLADLRDDGYEGIGSGGQDIQLQINTRAERPTGDLRVRQAIAHAIDVDLIDERNTQGKGVATTSIVDPNSPLYTDGAEGLAYDPDLAADLVEQAKADGWDGSVHFVCNADTPETGIAVQAQLEAAGFTVQADILPVTDMVSKVVALDFDVACWSLNVLNESAWAGIDRNLRSDSQSNRTGLQSPEMDAALVTLREASTNDEKQAALFELQQVWNDTVPGVILSRDEEWVTWGDDVHGVKVTREGVFMLDDVYVDG
jgi:peptide/nickel transport system substrate-binding protein